MDILDILCYAVASGATIDVVKEILDAPYYKYIVKYSDPDVLHDIIYGEYHLCDTATVIANYLMNERGYKHAWVEEAQRYQVYTVYDAVSQCRRAAAASNTNNASEYAQIAEWLDDYITLKDFTE